MLRKTKSNLASKAAINLAAETLDVKSPCTISEDRKAEITSIILEFRSSLPDYTKPGFFKSLEKISDFADRIVAMGDKLSDPFQIIEMYDYADNLAHYISWDLVFEGGNYSPMAKKLDSEGIKPTDVFASISAKLDQGITSDKKQSSLCDRLEKQILKLPLKVCAEYAQVLEKPRFKDSSALKLYALNSSKLDFLNVKAGKSAKDDQVDTVRAYFGAAMATLDPRYTSEGIRVSEVVDDDYSSLMLPFTRDPELRWVWVEPRLSDLIDCIWSKAKQDYLNDNKFQGSQGHNAAYLVIWSDGDPHQIKINERLKAGDYLPLEGISFSWTNKLTEENLKLVVEVAKSAAKDVADEIFSSDSRFLLPYERAFGEKFILSQRFNSNTTQASRIVRVLERLFIKDREGQGSEINHMFLKSADIGAVLLWHLAVDFWTKDNRWLKSICKNVDKDREGISTAIKLLENGYSAKNIIELYGQSESYGEAAKLAERLVKSDYSDQVKKGLLSKIGSSAITIDDLDQILVQRPQLDALTLLKLKSASIPGVKAVA